MNKGYANIRRSAIRRMLRYPAVALASHWVFQGLLYMDSTERWLKLVLDILLTIIGATALRKWLPVKIAWLGSFLLAHTLNFLFNGQLWGVLKHYKGTSNSLEGFQNYAMGIQNRLFTESSIDYVAVYGSAVREGLKSSSDLDVRVVAQPGRVNALMASWIVLKERTRALFCRFPLDIYAFNNRNSLQRMRIDEKPWVLIDRTKNTH